MNFFISKFDIKNLYHIEDQIIIFNRLFIIIINFNILEIFE